MRKDKKSIGNARTAGGGVSDVATGHGQAVSEVAHADYPSGRAHGEAVSTVARQHGATVSAAARAKGHGNSAAGKAKGAGRKGVSDGS